MTSRVGSEETATPMAIRDAVVSDLPAILGIYNQAVLETTSVWSDQPVELQSRERWLEERRVLDYPVLVAEAQGEVCGYASFGDFRPWPGYARTVENSVYVSPQWHRRGVGRALLSKLLDRGRARDKHVMVAGIEASNAASIALHAGLGFQEVGRLSQVGMKFDRWLDLVFMQVRLDSRSRP